MIPAIVGGVFAVIIIVILWQSYNYIGQTEVGLVTKRLGASLPEDNPIAFNGEAGYQADLLSPGLRFKFWPLFTVAKYPWLEVPPGEIGLVVAQVGKPIPEGVRSAVYDPSFGQFQDVRKFVEEGGQKGVQRPVLSPGTMAPIHPVAFLVATKGQVYGLPISPDIIARAAQAGRRYAMPEDFNLRPKQLEVTIIQPKVDYPAERGRHFTALSEEDEQGTGRVKDVIGVVTTLEGQPLEKGHIASRIGGWDDLAGLDERKAPVSEVIETILGSKNPVHNSFQSFQAFLDNGGRTGLQHDVLLYGGYNLNPILVTVDLAPMLTVEQGEVAVIKAYVGRPTEDVSGQEFKYGSLVNPGCRGIWSEPLRTGKYPINPHTYEAVIVPTQIITLSWAEHVTGAHQLDKRLMPIEAKSREGFVFRLDLQVQIHIPDTQAPRVISKVGTMDNLVNEVLQAAVGNHFRDKLQSLPGIKFIETRQMVQEEATRLIREKLQEYEVETVGVYIQDVVLPQELVSVLKAKEIANQEQSMYQAQETAQVQRVSMEHTSGRADKQKTLASSLVDIDIKKNLAAARVAEAEGEAFYVKETGKAEGAKVLAIGLAKARGYQEQARAIGSGGTTAVNISGQLAEGKQKFVPEIVVAGGGGTGEGLGATLMQLVHNLGGSGSGEVIDGDPVDYAEEADFLKAESPPEDLRAAMAQRQEAATPESLAQEPATEPGSSEEEREERPEQKPEW